MLSVERRGAITAFWRAWDSSLREAADGALATGDFTSLVPELSHHVEAIDPELHWEFGPGLESGHSLTLSANGALSRRRITEEWARSAPLTSGWEFHAARRARPQSTLTYAGKSFRVGDLRASISTDEQHRLADLVLFHKGFLGLDRAARDSVAVLLLDALLGEDAVERYVGRIEVARRPPKNDQDAAAITGAVARLEQMRPAFVALEGTNERGAPSRAWLNCSIKPIDHLSCTQHVAVTQRLTDVTAELLPTPAEESRLEGIERGLFAALARHPFAYLGHLTELGVRIFHLYVGDGTPLTSLLRSGPATEVAVQPDPEWEVHQALIGSLRD